MTDERALKLARNVYAQYIRDKNGEDVDEAKVQELVNGDIDGLHGVQIAIAAIKATTQLAAEYAHAHAHFGVKAGLLHFEHLPVDGGEK